MNIQVKSYIDTDYEVIHIGDTVKYTDYNGN
jgi:hypothetical protein